MMNETEQLKLQSFLDGELTGPEKSEVSAWIERESGASALLEEIRQTRDLLRSNEPSHTLDCSREFYWSGILKGIESQPPATRPESGPAVFLGWLQRRLAPVATTAAALTLLVLCLVLINREEPPQFAAEAPEGSPSVWNTPDPDTGFVSYQNQDTGFAMVWIYDRTKEDFNSP